MSGFTDLSQANKTNNMSMTSVQRSSTLLAESKRKEMENLKIQVDALKSENQLLQGKVKALASRKITLENELKEVKIDFEKKKQIFS